MLHFTNQELASANHVSVRTVRNWIDSAKAGKLDLSLQSKGERTFIANTSKNLKIIEGLVANGKKFRPHRSQKTVTPKPEFYDLFTQNQLYDLVSNLEINREIPRQYNYFGSGATSWDDYVNRLSEEESPNSLISTLNLLEKNSDYLDTFTSRHTQVNVIDVGVGNALPVRGLLTNLINQGTLGRYIAIDISQAMLDIAEKNINEWFGDKVNFEPHILDFAHDRFSDLLADEYTKSDASNTCNLILFLGGTIVNFKQPGSILKILRDSMGVNDYLIHSQKLDTTLTRRYFDFNPNSTVSDPLAPMLSNMFEMMNIDESTYEVEMGFDPELSERFIRARLLVALDIRFKFERGSRTISFEKGDAILLWRARQNSMIDVVKQLTDSGLYPLQVSQAENEEYLLTISRIKHD